MPSNHDIARDYKDLYRKTRVIGPEINKDMRDGLKAAGKIGARTAKLMIQSWPATGGMPSRAGGRKHRGLRTKIASQITVSVGARNVVIRQGTRGLTGRNSRDLPRDIDHGGWFHPVYGHGEVFQKGFPYFKAPIHAVQPLMEAEVSKVLDKIRRHLT
jgi:hypothetical protein